MRLVPAGLPEGGEGREVDGKGGTDGERGTGFASCGRGQGRAGLVDDWRRTPAQVKRERIHGCGQKTRDEGLRDGQHLGQEGPAIGRVESQGVAEREDELRQDTTGDTPRSVTADARRRSPSLGNAGPQKAPVFIPPQTLRPSARR